MCIRTIPYGYVVESGAKVIVADEATVITEVFERYCSGETFKQIADSLTERAIKFFEGNSSWNKNNIARMIDDDRYLGNEEYPPIISAELYSKVKTCLRLLWFSLPQNRKERKRRGSARLALSRTN